MSRTKLLTILTPAYNRRDGLERLYYSLLAQTNKNFEWLIVDDGSTDDTESFVDTLSTEDFIIRYVYKQNGGKHTALNVGIAQIDTELTFIVDSDDYLTKDAVAVIANYYEKYRKVSQLSGFAFLRRFPNGEINGKKFPKDDWVASYIESRINSHDTNADKAEVFFTNCLKEFPFPEYPGEKFLGEDIVWCRMARKYQMIHINKAIYIGNYQEDGLTQNRRRHNIASPLGCMHRSAEFLEKDINLKYRLKNGIQYVVYGKFAGYTVRNLMKESGHPLLIAICLLPGFLFYMKWRRGCEKE